MKNADRPINPIVQEEYIAGNRVLQCTQGGLTKREYFAGLAMQGIVSNTEMCKMLILKNNGESIAKDVSIMATNAADELLKALESDQ